MKKIKIIDAPCGFYKTTYAIQHMNNSLDDGKFIYITPFLTEVQRIKKSCVNKKFVEPINKGKGKLDNLHNMFAKGKNIVSTHALFRLSNNTTKELLKLNEYTLILDEVMNVVEKLDLKKDDIDTIISNKYGHIENDFLVWDKQNYNGRYNDIKLMAENKSIVIINDKALFWNFPVDIFECFKDVYILTYMFDCQIQKYYYDFHNMKYEYYSVKEEDGICSLIPYNKKHRLDKLKKIKEKINILQNDKINLIGENYYSLSASWFKDENNKLLVDALKNNLINYFKNKTQSKSDDKLWTTFKISKGKLGGKGYIKRFIPINSRATNEYQNTNVLAYCCNIFLHPDIKQFFTKRGIKVDENRYALSEQIQWIYRSAIRTNNPINIYIPSRRMRELLIGWIKE